MEKEETEAKYECVRCLSTSLLPRALTASQVCFIDPGNFRKIEDILKAEGKGTAAVEVLSLSTFKDAAKGSLPSGSGEEADDEEDQQAPAEEAGGAKKPQPVVRRRGQKMPGEPESEEEESDSDEKGKGKGKKKGRKKKPAAVAVTKPAAAKAKAQAKPTHPMQASDEDEEADGVAANMKGLSLKVPALPKRSALTSGSEAEAEDAAKPPVAKGAKGKAKGKAKATPTAFSALLEADDG